MDNTIVKHFLGKPDNVVNTDLLTDVVNGWFDAYELNSGQIQIIAPVGITAGQIIFEQTNDATVATGVPLQVNEVNTNGITSAAITVAANSNKMYQFAVMARFVRVRISTAIVGGQIKCAAYFSEQPVSSLMTLINPQSGAAATPVSVSAGLPAGPNQIGDVGLVYRANATGAGLIRRILAAAGTNTTLVKNTAGRIVGWSLANNTAATKYLKLYNQITAPTPGVGTPVITVALPPNQTTNFTLEGGIGFATGIAFTITGAVADNDTTALVANDVVGTIIYA